MNPADVIAPSPDVAPTWLQQLSWLHQGEAGLLTNIFITFFVIILVLYLINMLPIDRRINLIVRVIVLIIGVLSLLSFRFTTLQQPGTVISNLFKNPTIDERSAGISGDNAAPKLEVPKPLVEKKDDPKPADVPAPKLTEKKELKSTAEKTPEPQPQTKPDPIAEKLKKQDDKPHEAAAPASRPKIPDRVGAADGASVASGDDAASNSANATIAQKVVLYDEDPSDPKGKRYVGSALWRTETVSPGPGLAPELAIRADVEIPERHMRMTWSLHRNTDKALPASHTIEIMFTLPADFPEGGIANVPGVLMKQDERARGVPLAGLAVKVTNGYFLIGLSAVGVDVQRNIQLLKERAWFDIPVVYTSGKRAILAMEKGTPGVRAFEEAFRAWLAAAPQTQQPKAFAEKVAPGIAPASAQWPQSETKGLVQEMDAITISVNDAGRVFLQNAEIGVDLIPQLQVLAQTRGGTDVRIHVRGDKKVDYGTMMKVIGRLSGAGFHRIALVN